MNFKPTKDGGRILRGDTPFGSFLVEWNHKEELISHEVLIRTPDNHKPKGLGDTIKAITDKFGIKQCGGCKGRQKKLNEKYPYEGGS